MAKLRNAGELVLHAALQLGDRAGDLNPGGPTANHDYPQCFLGFLADVNFFVGQEQPAPDIPGLLDCLHLQGIFGDTRNTKRGSGATCCQDQLIPLDNRGIGEPEVLREWVNPHNFTAMKVNPGDSRPHRVGDVVLGQATGCHLIKQWRKGLIRISVNYRDVHARVLCQFSRAGQPGEPCADYYNLV